MKYEDIKQLYAAKLPASHKEFAQTRIAPNNNAEYFAFMTKAISRAGLNWKVIENKWDGFLTAFEGFDINRVAEYNDEDVDRLMCDKGIVRNRQKMFLFMNVLLTSVTLTHNSTVDPYQYINICIDDGMHNNIF